VPSPEQPQPLRSLQTFERDINITLDFSELPGLTVEKNVATIRLNRPKHHNRLAPEDLAVLVELVQQAQDNAAVRLLVITGSGEKSFCSGYTLQAIEQELDARFEEALNAVERCELPTLCWLNGDVYGGGMDLALCCDWRIGSAAIRAFMPAARFGLHYHADGLRRFTQRLGSSYAKELLLMAREISGERLAQMGFLTELAPSSEHASQLIELYSQSLSACDPQVVRTMKRQIDQISLGNKAAFVDRSEYLKSLGSEELRRRVRSIKK
jgi:enoyl-CoA hydratase/carnithine racemase